MEMDKHLDNFERAHPEKFLGQFNQEAPAIIILSTKVLKRVRDWAKSFRIKDLEDSTHKKCSIRKKGGDLVARILYEKLYFKARDDHIARGLKIGESIRQG